jgi:flagellar M-ring protein FliF
VHVTFPKESVFLESRQPAKASVLLRLRPGARISTASVTAVAHLVASAVEGLNPEAVSVLDMNGRLLNRPRRPSPSEGEQDSQAMLDFRQQVEKDLAAKINATLEPLLGPDKFRTGVSVECDFSGGEQSEETFDPSRTVMTSSQKTEDASGLAAAGGQPGTASNLPRPNSRPAASGGGMSRRTENITFQTSRVVRRVHLPQGVLKRVSAAILVDQQLRWEGAGPTARRVLEPPSPETLKSIRELVAAAIGLVAERGDQLILETLPFEATLSLEPPGPTSPPVRSPAPTLPPWFDRLLRQTNPLVLAAAGAGALLVLVLLALLWLWRRRRKTRLAALQSALPGGTARPALESGEGVQRAGTELESKLAEKQAERERQELEALHSMRLPKVTTKKTEVLTKHLVEVAKKDPTGTAHVLRTWLREI